MDANPTSTRIYLNPMFGKTHINPNFLRSRPSQSILVNPAFLKESKVISTLPVTRIQQGKIIAKSKTKIVRDSSTQNNNQSFCTSKTSTEAASPLIKIGNRKLVRASLVNANKIPKQNVSTSNLSKIFPRTVKYKVDHRILRISEKKSERKSFVSKYALNRIGKLENLASKRIPKASRRVCRLEKTLNKGKSLLNINGVLYKSSKTKLEKAAERPTSFSPTNRSAAFTQQHHKTSRRILTVRGNRFALDTTGHSLTRLKTVDETVAQIRLKRIDIGGFTYLSNVQGEFIRTDNHKTRNHLSTAKQKSINVLLRRMTKTNVPCPIFRKVGKCAAFERGSCLKVHDKRHVIICPRFLKGECLSDKCLLSHAVSLSKMPTCKFFLQGCCTRSNCPYLHKKLNEKTEICLEFLRGFCNLAEKCSKRHEFLCPDYESRNRCEKPRCPHEHRNDKLRNKRRVEGREKLPKKANKELVAERLLDLSTETGPSVSRYFGGTIHFKQQESSPTNLQQEENVTVDDEEFSNKLVVLGQRPKLGDLPAFIPL